MDQNLLKLFPPEYQKLTDSLLDKILERALVRAYQNLDEEYKTMMAQVFDTGSEEEKIKFLNTYLTNLNDLIIEEAQKVTKELQQKSAS